MCRKGQHWLGLEKLLTNSFEPINGSCNGIGPVERLEVAKLRMFVCFGDFFLSKKSFQHDWRTSEGPGSTLGTTLYQPRGDCFKKAGSPCRMIFWVILNLILAGFCFLRLFKN